MWFLQKISSLGQSTLVLAGIGGLAALAATYKLLSFVSSFLVWGWFLYEVGSTASSTQLVLFHRKKLALALLFLSTDYVMSQPWFLVPKFMLDLVRFPIFVGFNIWGETLLDRLLIIDFSQL